MNRQYTEDGVRLYKCLICFDLGWVHRYKSDGKIDYSKVYRCKCQAPIEKQEEFSIEQPKQSSRKKRRK